MKRVYVICDMDSVWDAGRHAGGDAHWYPSVERLMRIVQHKLAASPGNDECHDTSAAAAVHVQHVFTHGSITPLPIDAVAPTNHTHIAATTTSFSSGGSVGCCGARDMTLALHASDLLRCIVWMRDLFALLPLAFVHAMMVQESLSVNTACRTLCLGTDQPCDAHTVARMAEVILVSNNDSVTTALTEKGRQLSVPVHVLHCDRALVVAIRGPLAPWHVACQRFHFNMSLVATVPGDDNVISVVRTWLCASPIPLHVYRISSLPTHRDLLVAPARAADHAVFHDYIVRALSGCLSQMTVMMGDDYLHRNGLGVSSSSVEFCDATDLLGTGFESHTFITRQQQQPVMVTTMAEAAAAPDPSSTLPSARAMSPVRLTWQQKDLLAESEQAGGRPRETDVQKQQRAREIGTIGEQRGPRRDAQSVPGLPAATTATMTTTTTMTTTRSYRRCCWRARCRDPSKCDYAHTPEEIAKHASRGWTRCRKYAPCSDDENCRARKKHPLDPRNCSFAHGVRDAYCPTCEARGDHFMTECPLRNERIDTVTTH